MRSILSLLAAITMAGLQQAERGEEAAIAARLGGRGGRRSSSRGRGRNWSAGTRAKHRAKRARRCPR